MAWLTSRATPQWFADIDAVKSDALKAMDDIKFHPERCELSRCNIG